MKALLLILLPLNLFAQVATINLSNGTFINNAPSGRDWINHEVIGFSLGYTEYQVIIDENNPVIVNGITILSSGYQNQPPNQVHPPGNIFDNNLTTKWAAKGFGQWLQFTLREIRIIESVDVAFYYGDRNDIFDLLISMDSVNWTTVLDKQIGDLGTDFNNYDFVDIEVKHIKYVAWGNAQSTRDWNSIAEIKFNYVDPNPNEDCIPDTVYLPNIDTTYFDSTRWETKINWIDKDTTIINYKDSTIFHHVYDTTGSRIDTFFIMPKKITFELK